MHQSSSAALRRAAVHRQQGRSRKAQFVPKQAPERGARRAGHAAQPPESHRPVPEDRSVLQQPRESGIAYIRRFHPFILFSAKMALGNRNDNPKLPKPAGKRAIISVFYTISLFLYTAGCILQPAVV
jgi:hypothetical protein